MEYDKIWDFVEEKLKTPVPPYIKNIFKACGYNNGITIALIVADDLKYFVEEVRNGNIAKNFNSIDQKTVFEGSSKTAEDFEFTRGHQKFIMSIVDFLKNYLDQNGPSSLTLESEEISKRKPVKNANATKREASRISLVPKKKIKYSMVESTRTVHFSNTQEISREHSHPPHINNTEALLREDLKKERGILLNKTLLSLITHAPKMYVKRLCVCVLLCVLFLMVEHQRQQASYKAYKEENIEMIHTKISTDLVTMEIDKSLSESSVESVDGPVRYIAKISCPFCSKKIGVPQSFKKLSNGYSCEPWWNTSNFDRHVKIHQNILHFEREFNIENTDVLENLNVAPQSSPEDGDSVEIEENTMATIVSSTSGSMLQRFVNSSQRNVSRKKQGYRHDDVIKMFAAFIKMIAGLLAYETLHANFPLSLPSVSTVNRFITDNGPQIIEGEMRTDELLHYLQSRNLPIRVSLSEDATRITAKVSYDPNTNQLIGFALPLDKNGMPIAYSFQARNVTEIQSNFTNSSNFISSTAYVQMAQPMEPTSTAFCLMLFLTDSKFTAHNILKRWKFQAYKLKEKGIIVENISSDGDSRPLLAMKCLSCIGQSDRSFLDCEWYSCGGYFETTFTQDVTHIITKARNRILKCSRIFPIGNKIISSSHLKYLIDNVSKDKHLMTPYDIEPKDRQNFQSAEKVCSNKTIQCLLDYVPGSEGTAIYLKAVRGVLAAYLDTTITSKERIYMMWYSVFFFRAWRSWLLNSEKVTIPRQKRTKSYYNLKDNFISSNCYTCIELNAHALVKQVLVEDDDDSSEENSLDEQSKVFFPNLYSSQPCESMFRQVRSFTSTFSTVVNCSMLDIIHRVKKIQLQNDIIINSRGEIQFPRFQKKVANVSSSNPNNHRFKSLERRTIIYEIEKAKKAVTYDLRKFGIDTSKLNFHCQVEPVFEENMIEVDSDLVDSDSEEGEQLNEHLAEDQIENELEEEIQEDINALSGITGQLKLKDYLEETHSDGNITLNEKSPFVIVVDNKGKEMVVRKSSVCWLLSSNKYKLSSDRLLRVQEKEYANNISANKPILCADDFTVTSVISIGEWCIFSDDEGIEETNDEVNKKILLGLVLGFTYLKGKTFKEREFSKSSAPVQSDLASDCNKGIGVLCSFYTYDSVGVLTSLVGDKHKFIKIESYIGTIQHPIYTEKLYNNTLTISQLLIDKLTDLQYNFT